MTTIDINTLNGEDIIDVRDIIERIEELETEREDLAEAIETAEEAYIEAQEARAGDVDAYRQLQDAREALALWDEGDEAKELQTLQAILEDLKGYGGDEQWRGDWYPVTLIRESYFTDYTQEMLEDCGTIPRDLPHWIHIDWEATAREVMVDYSSVEIDGVTYLYR